MLRIADTDRERLIAVLRDHCVAGRLTLDEFSDRVGAVYAATTEDDLRSVLADLPGALPAPASPSVPPRPAAALVRRRTPGAIAIFGSAVSRVRSRVDDTPAAVAVFGESFLDLSAAVFEGQAPTEVTAFACFGDVTVVVPNGAEVDVEGFSIFGDRSVRVSSYGLGPVVHIKAYSIFGEVRVRTPDELGKRQRRLLR